MQLVPSIAITPASFLCINTLPSKLGRNSFHILLFLDNLPSVITPTLRPDSVHPPAWIPHRFSWIISLACDNGLDPNSDVRRQNLCSQQSAVAPQRTRLYECHPGLQRQLQVNYQPSVVLLCLVRGPCIS